MNPHLNWISHFWKRLLKFFKHDVILEGNISLWKENLVILVWASIWSGNLPIFKMNGYLAKVYKISETKFCETTIQSWLASPRKNWRKQKILNLLGSENEKHFYSLGITGRERFWNTFATHFDFCPLCLFAFTIPYHTVTNWEKL